MSRNQKIISYLAFSLFLLAPFIAFLRFNAYTYDHPEVFVLGGVLLVISTIFTLLYYRAGKWEKMIAAGIFIMAVFSFFQFWSTLTILLLTLLIVMMIEFLLAEKFLEMMIIIVVAFLTGILFFPMSVREINATVWKNSHGALNKNLPPIIYIILDEHGGISAIPTNTQKGRDLKASLKSFYLENGFRVYGDAYSHYGDTYNSIPNFLNFSQIPIDNAYFNNADFTKTGIRHLTQNKFFDLLAKKGYQFRIYESDDYLDYCHVPGVEVDSCYAYPMETAGLITKTPMPFSQRFVFLYKSFLLQSSLYRLIATDYALKIQPIFQKSGFLLPNIFAYDMRVSSLSMLKTFAKLQSDILQKPAMGTVYFAHILSPHSPYIYNADCQMLPLKDWKDGGLFTNSYRNTVKSREKNYAIYEEQTACVEKQMQGVINNLRKAGVYDKSIIIVQGDHGSRISLLIPAKNNQNELTHQDFKDFFVTLFAVKDSQIEPGYDTHLFDLQALLANVTEKITGDKINIPKTQPYVFLELPPLGQSLQKKLVKDFH